MIVDDNAEIRLFLIGCGFVQDETTKIEYGNFYRYFIPECELLIYVNISMHKAEARFPDKQYNKINPYSTKQCVTEFFWGEKETVESVIENLKMFFNKAFNAAKD